VSKQFTKNYSAKSAVRLPDTYDLTHTDTFHSIPFPSRHSHSHTHETGVAIPIPMGFPWDPVELGQTFGRKRLFDVYIASRFALNYMQDFL